MRPLQLLVACFLFLVATCVFGGNDVWLQSANGRLHVEIDAVGGRGQYGIDLDGRPLLYPARLGPTFRDADLSADLRLVDEGEPADVEDRYFLVGREPQIEGRANERTALFENPDGVRLAVTFRAYDDAVAIRYVVAESLAPTLVVEDTLTFAFAEPGRAWIQPHDLPGLAKPAYEAEYANGVPIGHAAPVPSWNMPALFETGGRWVLLAESDAGPGDYGAHVRPIGGTSYQIELPQPSEGLSTAPAGEPASFPWRSPWRVVVASDDLADIATTDVITHLAESSRIADTSFIEPGRVSWSWWSDHSSPRNPAALRDFVDLAAEFGWEHTLIDANWNLMPTDELTGIIDYATERGVGVFLWYNSGGPNNVVTEQPRDRMHEADRRKQEFAWLAQLGVRGVKVDFFHSDRADIIERYLAIAADAADAGLMVNFHGSTVPRGWERTWPNIMTMEAVRGAEQYGFEAGYPEAAVWHNAILPFTRNAIGPMDYTPVTFSNQAHPHLTTSGHELALAVVYESALQHMADSAVSYRSQPEAVQAFLRAVPATWDESRLLSGYPGEHALFARRSGGTWFVGSIGGPATVSVEVDFSFLDGASDVTLIGDGLRVDRRAVGPTDRWEVDLAVGGGFVMLVEPQE